MLVHTARSHKLDEEWLLNLKNTYIMDSFRQATEDYYYNLTFDDACSEAGIEQVDEHESRALNYALTLAKLWNTFD